ncbi:MAG: methyltransferase domain-containing protein [Burkholderiales bacterium]
MHTSFVAHDPSTTSLAAWFESPLGRYLLEREQGFFDGEVADVFGFHALQFGLPGYDFLRTNRIATRHTVGMEACVTIRADTGDLPVATSSVDLVLLPHTLEFSSNPHQLLREVQRILVPEGHIVLSGFNPWSLWGVARLLAGRGPDYPWCGQFIGLPRLKDWIALLGFEVSAGRMAAYAPPWGGDTWLRRLRFMEQAGDRWWPIAGGIYVMHAIKRVKGAKLITPKWRMAVARKKVLSPMPQKYVQPHGIRRTSDGHPCERECE